MEKVQKSERYIVIPQATDWPALIKGVGWLSAGAAVLMLVMGLVLLVLQFAMDSFEFYVPIALGGLAFLFAGVALSALKNPRALVVDKQEETVEFRRSYIFGFLNQTYQRELLTDIHVTDDSWPGQFHGVHPRMILQFSAGISGFPHGRFLAAHERSYEKVREKAEELARLLDLPIIDEIAGKDGGDDELLSDSLPPNSP